MQVDLLIEAKQVGQSQPIINDWSVQVESLDYCLPLRALLSQIVRAEVSAFRERQAERRLLRVMTRADIEDAKPRGKFEMGARPITQIIDEQAAVETALQAFEDGLYYVFIDRVQPQTLDQVVELTSRSTLRFIRLIPLAGG